MILKGTIRSVGNYADGADRLEIAITDHQDLPIITGARVEYKLRIEDKVYQAGIRSTNDAGVWVSPDLYTLDDSNGKVRLVDLLLKSGFERNQKIVIHFNTTDYDFSIEPAGTAKKKKVEIPYLFGIGKSKRQAFDENEKQLQKVNKLKDLVYAEELIDIFKHYVNNFIPTPEALENTYWMSSCLPGTGWAAIRINMYWHEVFRIHLGDASTDEETYWEVMMFTDKKVLDKAALKELVKKYPYLKNHKKLHYDKGLDSQQPIIIPAHNYFEIIEEQILIESIRQYNFQLMQKGRRVHGGHNYYLASLAMK